ncbi:hypothetical protein ACA910_005832 [Epithemia clementina (nom. ined.)]
MQRQENVMNSFLAFRVAIRRCCVLRICFLSILMVWKLHAFSILSIPSPQKGHMLRRQVTLIPWGIPGKSAFKSREILVGFSSNSKEQVVEDVSENDFFEAILPDSTRDQVFSRDAIQKLTITQLKQQLRLRGLKVSGRKAELVERFLQHQSSNSAYSQSRFINSSTDAEYRESSSIKEDSKAGIFAQEHGKELVDVSDFVEPEDRGKSTKTWKSSIDEDEDEDEDDLEGNGNSDPEVWGAEARMVDDYEGGRIVIDCLSRSTVEFQGSNQSFVQAYVVASRDALKPYLAGGKSPSKNATRADTPAEQRLRDIQTRREQAAKRPIRFDDNGLDEGDETGIYNDVIHRDFSDWGVYTATGAQLSATEVQGVLLLSDVYGAFSDDTRALAEKIAFECQPVVVMVPDLFRGQPWTGPTSETNDQGETYEEWRAKHSDLRVNIDIRAAAACLRERYGVSCVVVWGTCYGGGRALEAAAGWFPDRNIHDVDGRVGPPPVEPMACVAWYPTRYNITELFGPHHVGTARHSHGKDRRVAVMAVFGEKDTIPGATKSDAEALVNALAADKRVKDHMVKVFPDQDHGFAHRGLGTPQVSDGFDRFVDEEFGGAGQISMAEGDAEVACLLSTAFFETYSRVFLPTVGPPISLDPDEDSWSRELSMSGRSDNEKRDVRKEIENAMISFVEEPLGGIAIDPNDESQEEELMELLRRMEGPEQKAGPYALEDDDNLSTIYAKLRAADQNFQIF